MCAGSDSSVASAAAQGGRIPWLHPWPLDVPGCSRLVARSWFFREAGKGSGLSGRAGLKGSTGCVAGSSQPALKDITPKNGFFGSTLAADPVLAALVHHEPSPWAGHCAQQTLFILFFSFDLLKSGAALPEGLSAGKAEADPTPEMLEII